LHVETIINYYIRSRLDNHEKIKSQVLSLINYSDNSGGEYKDENYHSKISKLDWEKNADFQRPWVKIILPSLTKTLDEMIDYVGYKRVDMKVMWFQQYTKNCTHDWHVHSENYTGVYYLEYPEGSPATNLYDNNMLTPKVSEGDVVIFPAMTPHQAPMVKSDSRKTIISYNFNVGDLNLDYLKQIRNVENETK
jgi:hypothetical protein